MVNIGKREATALVNYIYKLEGWAEHSGYNTSKIFTSTVMAAFEKLNREASR